MSYCRWSTDNFQCDLYCYEDVSGGYTIHVAARRSITPYPYEGSYQEFIDLCLSNQFTERWLERHKKWSEETEKIKKKSIGLPYDGETFNDPNLEAFLDRLLMLREVGYKFPDYVLENVKHEIMEEKSIATPTEGKE